MPDRRLKCQDVTQNSMFTPVLILLWSHSCANLSIADIVMYCSAVDPDLDWFAVVPHYLKHIESLELPLIQNTQLPELDKLVSLLSGKLTLLNLSLLPESLAFVKLASRNSWQVPNLHVTLRPPIPNTTTMKLSLSTTTTTTTTTLSLPLPSQFLHHHRRLFNLRASSSPVNSSLNHRVVTRERGKNDKLITALPGCYAEFHVHSGAYIAVAKHGIDSLELPLIQNTQLPEPDKLVSLLSGKLTLLNLSLLPESLAFVKLASRNIWQVSNLHVTLRPPIPNTTTMKLSLSTTTTTTTTLSLPLPSQFLHHHRRLFNLRASSSPVNSSLNHRVVTRERGKNDKLITALAKHGIESLELPLIQNTQLPELDKLVSLLSGPKSTRYPPAPNTQHHHNEALSLHHHHHHHSLSLPLPSQFLHHHRRLFNLRASSSPVNSSLNHRVVTRERGKNDKLITALPGCHAEFHVHSGAYIAVAKHGIESLELPLIQNTQLRELDKLVSLLSGKLTLLNLSLLPESLEFVKLASRNSWQVSNLHVTLRPPIPNSTTMKLSLSTTTTTTLSLPLPSQFLHHHRRLFNLRASSSPVNSSLNHRVVTRERGKNDKLITALPGCHAEFHVHSGAYIAVAKHGIESLELPLIQNTQLRELDKLVSLLSGKLTLLNLSLLPESLEFVKLASRNSWQVSNLHVTLRPPIPNSTTMKLSLSTTTTTTLSLPLPSQFLHHHRRLFNLRASSSPVNSSLNHRVVTRERGKNDKHITALAKHGIESLELPLIQHTQLPELDKLVSLLSGKLTLLNLSLLPESLAFVKLTSRNSWQVSNLHVTLRPPIPNTTTMKLSLSTTTTTTTLSSSTVAISSPSPPVIQPPSFFFSGCHAEFHVHSGAYIAVAKHGIENLELPLIQNTQLPELDKLVSLLSGKLTLLNLSLLPESQDVTQNSMFTPVLILLWSHSCANLSITDIVMYWYAKHGIESLELPLIQNTQLPELDKLVSLLSVATAGRSQIYTLPSAPNTQHHHNEALSLHHTTTTLSLPLLSPFLHHHRRLFNLRASSSPVNSSLNHRVVTRERGKNDKLITALAKHGIENLELPLIQNTQLPELDKLVSLLSGKLTLLNLSLLPESQDVTQNSMFTPVLILLWSHSCANLSITDIVMYWYAKHGIESLELPLIQNTQLPELDKLVSLLSVATAGRSQIYTLPSAPNTQHHHNEALSLHHTTTTLSLPLLSPFLHHHRRLFNLRASSSPVNSSLNHRVVTRERGKNDKLITALAKHGIESLELPLIQNTQLPELDKLVSLLSGKLTLLNLSLLPESQDVTQNSMFTPVLILLWSHSCANLSIADIVMYWSTQWLVRAQLVNMSYTICGFATEANMLPPAISIQDMANIVWSILHCSDLQSGWPYGAQQWGLSCPNSTIQNYHAEHNALLTVRAPRVAGNDFLGGSSDDDEDNKLSKLPSCSNGFLGASKLHQWSFLAYRLTWAKDLRRYARMAIVSG
ncbi:hypothetical protein E3N88_20757 [Mikania micrantha]|uniref:Uroporphyrinogen-III synthase n=1 Tax=Mikania micrantha TaxID=192012 RepID=A0A5N6NIC4_9ASTR|nr:hypothetical protein E3N88_20757 [Mikania micrantha]